MSLRDFVDFTSGCSDRFLPRDVHPKGRNEDSRNEAIKRAFKTYMFIGVYGDGVAAHLHALYLIA